MTPPTRYHGFKIAISINTTVTSQAESETQVLTKIATPTTPPLTKHDELALSSPMKTSRHNLHGGPFTYPASTTTVPHPIQNLTPQARTHRTSSTDSPHATTDDHPNYRAARNISSSVHLAQPCRCRSLLPAPNGKHGTARREKSIRDAAVSDT